MRKPTKQSKEAAESVAIQGLTFLAADPEQLGRFLAACGLGPDSLRSAARDPAFLGGILDHLTQDESLLLAFAREAEVEPRAIVAARDILAGRPWERDVP